MSQEPGPSRGEVAQVDGRRVWVRRVPLGHNEETLRDKLLIHFLKPSKGGGEVLEVIYPTEIPGCALLTFQDSQVARRVMKHKPHILSIDKVEHELQVSPYSDNKVIEKVTMVVNLETLRDDAAVLGLLKSSGLYHRRAAAQWFVEGTFREVQRVHDELLYLVSSEHNGGFSLVEHGAAAAHFGTTSHRPPEDAASRKPSSQRAADESFESRKGFSKQHSNAKALPDPSHPSVDPQHKAESKRPFSQEEAGDRLSLEHIEKCKLMSLKADNSKMPEVSLVNRTVSTVVQAPHQQIVPDKSKLSNNRNSHPRPVGLQQLDSRSVSVQTNNCRFTSESAAALPSTSSKLRANNGAEPVKADNQKQPLDWSHGGTHGDTSTKIPNREKAIGHPKNSKATPMETAKGAAPRAAQETETRGRSAALHDKKAQPTQRAGAHVVALPERGLHSEEYSVAMDTDVFQYIKKFYKQQYNDVLSRNHAECVECESGEITTVYFQSQAVGRLDDADGKRKMCRARNELSTFYQKFQDKLCQEWVDLSPASLSVEKLTKICQAMQNKYKEILIKRYQAEFCLVGEISKVYEAASELKSYNKLPDDDQRGILEGDTFTKSALLYKTFDARTTEGLYNISGSMSSNFMKDEAGAKEKAPTTNTTSGGGANSDGRASNKTFEGQTDTSHGYALPEMYGMSAFARRQVDYANTDVNSYRSSFLGRHDEANEFSGSSDGVLKEATGRKQQCATMSSAFLQERGSRVRSADVSSKIQLRSQSLDVPFRSSQTPDEPFDLSRCPESVAMDTMVWTYIETFHKARCRELGGKYNVDVAKRVDGDIVTLQFSSANKSIPECDPRSFGKEIAQLYNSVEKTLGQQFIPIDEINLLRESGGIHGIATMKHVWRRLKERFPEVLFSESAGGICVVGRSEECVAAANELRMVNTTIADDQREAEKQLGPSNRQAARAVGHEAGARSKHLAEQSGFRYESATANDTGAAADVLSWPLGGSDFIGESNGASTSSSSTTSLSSKLQHSAGFDRCPEEMLSLHNEQRMTDYYASSHFYFPSASGVRVDRGPSNAPDHGASALAEHLQPREEADRGRRRNCSDAHHVESAVKKQSNVEKIADDTFSVDALKFQYLEKFCKVELDGILKRYNVQITILQQKPNLVLKLTACATGAGKVEDASKVFLVWYLNKCYSLHIEYLLMDGVAVQLSEEEIQIYSTDLQQRNPPLLLTRHNDLIVIVGQKDGCLAAVHGLAELLAACVSREPSGRTPHSASSEKDSQVSPRHFGEGDGRRNPQNHVHTLPQRHQQKQTRGLEGAKTSSRILPNRFSFETRGAKAATLRSPSAKEPSAKPRSSESRGRQDNVDVERGSASGALRRSSSLPRNMARQTPVQNAQKPKDSRADVCKAQDMGRRLQKSQDLLTSAVSTKTNLDGAALKDTNVFAQGLSSRHSAAAIKERADEGLWTSDGSAAGMRRWTSLEELGGSRRNPANATGEGRASPRDELREHCRTSPAPLLSLEKTCSRCQQFSGQVVRLNCGHCLCDRCLGSPPRVPAEARASFCPMCLLGEAAAAAEGAVAGSDLGGSMSSAVLNFPLPGHSKQLTIKITYNIPDGIQGRRDPYPGRPYFGGTFEAYLPDSPEGRRVLSLLTNAFQRGLTFAVRATGGTSGQARVTWNGIPHKTAVFSSSCGESYPDSSYLTRVCNALRAKGVE
ncbi:unnamed protein product [Lampetra planeri]